jgi:hypothetical protein
VCVCVRVCVCVCVCVSARNVSLFQMESLLAMDAASVLFHGLMTLIQREPERVHYHFRRGQVYNNDLRGINCRSDPLTPWALGPLVMKYLQNVSGKLDACSV